MDDVLKFSITNLRARVIENVNIEWRGKEFDAGPLDIEIDDTVPSGGMLNYAARRAEAEFHVLLTFREFADTLEQLGADAELTEPVHAVINSAGEIHENHSFILNGRCDIEPHALLNPEGTKAFILPGT